MNNLHKIHRHVLPILLIALGAITSVLIFRYAMICNIGLSNDDIAYVSAARNLIAGNGYTTGAVGEGGNPLTHFPPGYTTLLALVSLGTDPIARINLLHTFLFAFNTALLGFLVFKTTNRSSLAILITLILFLSSRMFQGIHLMAFSEPPFITCMLLIIWSCAKYIERPRLLWAIIAALLTGCAILLRYVGITLIPALLITLFLSTRPLKFTKQRLVHGATVLSLSILPFLLWLFRNNIVAETSTNRSIGYHPVTTFALQKMVETMYNFWMPINILGQIPTLKQMVHVLQIVIIVCSILFVALYIIVRERKEGENHNTFTPFTRASLYFSLTFIFTYLPFLFISITFYDAITPLDDRILSIWHLMLLLTSVISLYHIIKQKGNILAAGILLFLVSFFLLFNINSGATNLMMIRIHGFGYNASKWATAFEEIDHTHTNGINVYTNSVLQARLLFNHETFWLPPLKRNDFEAFMSNIKKEVLAGEAVIVIINHGYEPVVPPPVEMLVEKYALPLYFTNKHYTLIGNQSAFTSRTHKLEPESCMTLSLPFDASP